MAPLLVTSNCEGAGRTAFCAGLSRFLGRRQRSTFLCKPLRVAASDAQRPDPDATFFASLTGMPQPEPWPLSINGAEAQRGLDPSTREGIASSFGQITDKVEAVIIEGPPATTAQGPALAAVADLAEVLDASVVALIRYAPDLRVEAAIPMLEAFGDRLLGVVVNGVTRYKSHTVGSTLVPALEARSIKVIGLVPEARCMQGITVGKLVDHLEGEFLPGEEKRDQLVEHLMIGGMVMNPGIDYFSRHDRKAIIVRGDRPDIQMASLATPTQCLVLTGGHRPIQYVEHEARAEGVPLAIVESDTLTTAKNLETLLDGVTAHHAEKAGCFAELLEKAVDLETLDAALRAG